MPIYGYPGNQITINVNDDAHYILGQQASAYLPNSSVIRAGNNVTITFSDGYCTISAQATGGSGGSGTVTDFSAGDLSPLFTTSEATTTTTPALSFTMTNTGSANVLAGPASGANGAYSFRKLTGLDLGYGLVAGANITLTMVGSQLSVASTDQYQGTVTNFSAGDLSPLFTTSEATTTTTPALTFNASNAASATCLSGPASGPNGAYSFRRLTGFDLNDVIVPGSNVTVTNLGGTLQISATDTNSGGTVTSFSAGDLAPLFTTSEATVTTTPALTFNLTNTGSANVLAGPASGADGAYSFRKLTYLDLDYGLEAGSGITFTPVGSKYRIAATAGGGGTVTDFSAGDLAPLFTTTEATTTTTPALTFNMTNTASANVLAGPASGANGAYSFRKLTGLDLGYGLSAGSNITLTMVGSQLQVSATDQYQGTVTNFSAGDLSPLFTTSEATTTTTPALTFNANNAASATCLSGPASGADGAYSFRHLTWTDLDYALEAGANITLTAVGNKYRVAASDQYQGTVTNFSAGDLSPLFTTSEATTTTTPALTFNLTNTGSANVLAGPASGADGAYTFRKLTGLDLGYGLSAGSNITLTMVGSQLQIAASDQFQGTVTNFSAGDLSPLFTTSEATTTTTPALTFNMTNTASANVLAGPASGADGAYSFRKLTGLDLGYGLSAGNGITFTMVGSQLQVASTGGGTTPMVNNYRLSLTSNTPVTTSDVSAAGTLYLTPYNGNQIALYNGSTWDLLTTGQISITPTSSLHRLVDVFVYNNSGTAALELNPWDSGGQTTASITAATAAAPVVVTSNSHGLSNGNFVFIDGANNTVATDSARGINGKCWKVANATTNTFELEGSDGSSLSASTSGTFYKVPTARTDALAYQNGILVKSGTPTRRYVGTIMTVASAQTEDSVSRRLVYNYYNRIPRSVACRDTTSSWTWASPASNTVRCTNRNSTAGVGRVEVVNGIQEQPATLITSGPINNATNNRNVSIGIGINSCIVNSAENLGPMRFGTNYHITTASGYRSILPLGYVFIQNEDQNNSVNDNTPEWDGDNGAPLQGDKWRQGLTGEVIQ